MVMVLINWLYIAVTTFLCGFGILQLFSKLFQYKIRHTISYFLAGLTFTTVYAQFYSLFAGVSVMANLLLILFCIVIVFVCKKALSDFSKQTIQSFKEEKWKFVAYLLLTILFSYATSRGYMHFDTGLYHAQSIRWIEEYGVVPGLGNVQSRFGYNSAAFPLTALYSMKNIFGQSLHATAGFFALLGSFIALDIYKVFSQKRIRLSDFVRIGLIFYLGVLIIQIMSPASDYYAQLLLFMILILWLEEDDYQNTANIKSATPYALLCILIVYAVTIKFSVTILLLLVLKPAVMLLKNKNIGQIFIYIFSGFVTALPFFIRNILITGWLVYPFAGIDLFHFDWKIPKEQVVYDSNEIGIYGKGITDVSRYNAPFSEWIPIWFDGLKTLEKIFVLMTVLAIICGCIYVIFQLVKKRFDFSLVFAVLVASTSFWFVSAPLVRYGYAYITVLPLLVFGQLFLSIINANRKFEKIMHSTFCVLLCLFLLSRIPGLFTDIKNSYKKPFYFAQMDYPDGEARTQNLSGITFYIPTQNGQIGYKKFPSSMFQYPIELRGDSIEDGFRQISSE